MAPTKRRFLIKPDSFDPATLPDSTVEESVVDAYMIATDKHQALVRMVNMRYCSLCVRAIDADGKEQEIKAPISLNMFEKNAKTPIGRRLAYKRHSYTDGYASIAINVYQQALDGLIIAEVTALRSARFKPPEWFGAEITKKPEKSSHRLVSLSRYKPE